MVRESDASWAGGGESTPRAPELSTFRATTPDSHWNFMALFYEPSHKDKSIHVPQGIASTL